MGQDTEHNKPQRSGAESFSGVGLNENASAGDNGWVGATPSELAEAESAEGTYAVDKKISAPNKNAILLVLACLAGVGGVYLFGLKQTPQEASAQDKAVEAQVDQVLKELDENGVHKQAADLFTDTESMVQIFYEYSTKKQVSLDELQRDPFAREGEVKKGSTVDEDALAREALQKELTQKAGQLKLQSVLQGVGGGKCLINGDVYGVGQQVAGTFTVQTINNESVVLAADGFEFVLGM